MDESVSLSVGAGGYGGEGEWRTVAALESTGRNHYR